MRSNGETVDEGRVASGGTAAGAKEYDPEAPPTMAVSAAGTAGFTPGDDVAG